MFNLWALWVGVDGVLEGIVPFFAFRFAFVFLGFLLFLRLSPYLRAKENASYWNDMGDCTPTPSALAAFETSD